MCVGGGGGACTVACTSIIFETLLKKGKMLLGEEMGVAGMYGNESF